MFTKMTYEMTGTWSIRTQILKTCSMIVVLITRVVHLATLIPDQMVAVLHSAASRYLSIMFPCEKWHLVAIRLGMDNIRSQNICLLWTTNDLTNFQAIRRLLKEKNLKEGVSFYSLVLISKRVQLFRCNLVCNSLIILKCQRVSR